MGQAIQKEADLSSRNKETEGEQDVDHDHGETGADQPADGRTARDSTSINPEDEEPILPDSPSMPPA